MDLDDKVLQELGPIVFEVKRERRRVLIKELFFQAYDSDDANLKNIAKRQLLHLLKSDYNTGFEVIAELFGDYSTVNQAVSNDECDDPDEGSELNFHLSSNPYYRSGFQKLGELYFAMGDFSRENRDLTFKIAEREFAGSAPAEPRTSQNDEVGVLSGYLFQFDGKQYRDFQAELASLGFPISVKDARSALNGIFTKNSALINIHPDVFLDFYQTLVAADQKPFLQELAVKSARMDPYHFLVKFLPRPIDRQISAEEAFISLQQNMGWEHLATLVNMAYSGLDFDQILFRSVESIHKGVNDWVSKSEFGFFGQYLQSDFSRVAGVLKSQSELIEDLKQLVNNPVINYDRLSLVLNVGKVRDLQEMVDCSQVYYPADKPDYIAVQRLGKGVFGTSYLMKNIGISEGMKFVYKVSNADEYDISLERELQNLAQIPAHPNVVKVHGPETAVIRGRKKLAIRMEYIPGRTLEEVSEKGPIELGQTLNYAREMLRGLNHIHENGIYHRDLKPGNIMVTDDGTVKLIDFGLSTSKQVVDQPCKNRLYAPPEFVHGQNQPNSDIWSVGMILYEMITGQYLFAQTKLDKARAAKGHNPEEEQKEYVVNMMKDLPLFKKELEDKYYLRIDEAVKTLYSSAEVNMDDALKLAMFIKGCLTIETKKDPSNNEMIPRIESAQIALKMLMEIRPPMARDYSI